jgi:hypothetical protein
MATTTPNFGWPVPTSTDYVKDGATAIEALGDAIDATVATLGSGLTKITSQTFTTTSTVQVNSCFSATYLNYRVLLKLTAASASAGITLQFSTGGTPSATGYYGAGLAMFSGGASASVGQAGAGSLTINDVTSTNPTFAANSLDIFSPFLAQNTICNSLAFGETGAGGVKATFQGGLHLVGASYDGLTIKPSSGTISGTISIYGYQV